MSAFSRRSPLLLIVGLLLLAFVLASAMAASNTVPASSAGQGSNTVSGYTISNIAYDVDNNGDPTDVEVVTFDATDDGGSAIAPTLIELEVSSGAGFTGASCSVTSSIGATHTISCTLTPAVAVSAVDIFNVVIAQ
jgi:hypothetical protein